MGKTCFRLYLSDQSQKRIKMINDLKTILDRHLKDNHEIEVIYSLQNPDLLERDNIIATPTLVKYFPLPARMIIGDVNNEETILEWLDL
ncbi:MAG: circadian clock KaiB family protein [Candidatus Anammoxibacter sp.]